MDLSLYQIGRFQFENLIQNRIPFVLVHFGQDLKGLFQPHHLALAQARQLNVKDHLIPQNWFSRKILKQYFSQEGLQWLFNELESLQIDRHQAIVILSETGEEAEALFLALLQKEYMNAFYVLGGLQNMKNEMENTAT